VVIPTHDRLELLRRTTATLLRDPAADQLIVVDTSHGAATAAWLRGVAAREPRVEWLRSRDCPADAARQAGLERASGEWVVFLDDDVTPTPTLISGHRKRAQAGPRVVVGVTPIAGPARRLSAAERVYAREYRGRIEASIAGGDVLSHLWGGNVSLPRNSALEIGMVAEESLPYHEDRDFGLRCLAAGMDAVLAPELSAPHRHRRSNASGAHDARRRGAAVVILARRHPGLVTVDDPARGLGRLGRMALGLCRPPAIGSATTTALAGAASALGALRVEAGEEAVYRLWRRIEEQHGQIEQMRSHG
jgi:GT2 family glycosyltransferase